MARPTNIGQISVDGISGAFGGDLPATTGKVWYVDSTTGSSANAGSSPDFPLATIDQAVNKCTANKGDQILVMPNHAENITAATSLSPDVAGISIIGLGAGRNRPTLTFTATGSHIDIGAADITIKNLVFLASVSAVVAGIDVNANDFTLESCEFNWDETGDDFVIAVDVDAYDRTRILNCKFIMEDAAGSNEAIRLDDAQNVEIEGCRFTGDFTNAMIYSASGDAAGVGLLIQNCSGHNSDTTLGANIRLACAFTGLLSDNAFGTAYVTKHPHNTFDPGSCQCVRNMVSVSTDTDAYAVPWGVNSGEWRLAYKRLVYYGGSGTAALAIGTVGTYGYFSVTGTIEAKMAAVIGTSLTGTNATMSVGVTGDTDALLPVDTATNLDANEVWIHTGGAASAAAWTDLVHAPVVIDGRKSPSIFHTVATADVSGGAARFSLWWRALDPDAMVRPT